MIKTTIDLHSELLFSVSPVFLVLEPICNRIASSHAFLPGKTLKFLMSFVDVTALNASQNDFS